MNERYVNVPGFPEREQFTDNMTAARNDKELALIARHLDEIDQGGETYDLDTLVDSIADISSAYNLTADEMSVVLSHLRQSPEPQPELGTAV